VLLLDVSPASFGPVEATTRLAAHIVALALMRARLPAWLMTAGAIGLVMPLERPADLVELWTRRSLDAASAVRSLSRARALREGLRAAGVFDPAVVLLAEAHFGAEEEPEAANVIPGLRALFVQHPGQGDQPAWAHRCERWSVVTAGEGPELGVVLGELLA
jgi:ATP-dependent Clp protease ATP-binding subunit ClpC